MKEKKLITLSELAQERNVLKSRLLYYNKLGMIMPSGIKGKTFLFDKEQTVKILDLIQVKSKQGFALWDIKNKILPTL